MRDHAVVVVTAILACGCGKVSSEAPDGADTLADSPLDTAGDTGIDPGPDVPIDTAGDTSLDTSLDTPDDTIEDTPEDEAGDPGLDLPDGWPTENPADWPYPTHGQCGGVGGFCSGDVALLCPWGYEPSPVHLHGHCAGGGWCCVTGPYSECTDSGTANCFPGTDCATIDACLFPPSTAMSCEAGRTCCVDICT